MNRKPNAMPKPQALLPSRPRTVRGWFAPFFVAQGALARPDGRLVQVSGLTESPAFAGSRDGSREGPASSRMQTGRPRFVTGSGQWVLPLRGPIRKAGGRTVALETAGCGLTSGRRGIASVDLVDRDGWQHAADERSDGDVPIARTMLPHRAVLQDRL